MIVAPRRLNRGDKVAIIAPSSPFKSNELADGLDTITSHGLIPVLGPNVSNLNVFNIHAAPLSDRIKEFNWAFSDPDIKAVICATGGYGCAEILPHINYALVRKSRKIFIGMSDSTALNNALLMNSGLVNLNAQTPAISLDKGNKVYTSEIESLSHTLKLCMSNLPWGDRPFKINDHLPRTISPGNVVGTAIGGNLDTFCCLLGTQYLPEVGSPILFIEDVHKGSIAVARHLLHLKLAGIFDTLAGIVVGEFAEMPENKDERSPSMEDILLYYLGDLDIPVLYGYSFSHGAHTCPIPIGATTNLDATNRSLSFDFTLGR